MNFLELDNIMKYFPVRRGFLRKTVNYVKAADGISLSMQKSENLGIVGESGCGKSTLARIIVKLIQPDSGNIIFQGEDLSKYTPNQMRPVRKDIQIVFQDPYNSLDPRFTVRDIIKEAFISSVESHRTNQDKKIEELIDVVGLSVDCLSRFPYELWHD